MLGHAIQYIKKHKKLFFLIVPAFTLHMLMMMPSGTNICIGSSCGIHFWGVHSHDAMWHLEIAEVAFRTYPFQVPTFAGAVLSGYNILMDIILFAFSKIGIPTIFTLFKIIPVVWFGFYTLMTISFARTLRDSLRFVFISLFLVYFAGHFGYLIQLYHSGSIFLGGQSFSMQSIDSLLNTQFALTLPMILAQLIILNRKMRTRRAIIGMGALTFVILGLKFYGGVMSLSVLGWYLVDIVLDKKSIRSIIFPLIIYAFSVVASIVLFYDPFAASASGSIFTFSPFATVHSMIEAPDMIYLPDMVNARYFLYENGWSPRLLYIELVSMGLYIMVNFGTRVFGLIYILVRIGLRKSRFELYLFVTIVLSVLLTVFLIQKGDWWNTVQFGYYGIFLSNFFLAIFIDDMLKKYGRKAYVFVAIIGIVTIPSTVQSLRGMTTLTNTLYISRPELEAMKVLKSLPDGTVYNSFQAPEGYSFLDYRTSGYVSAFTGKQMYLAHPGPLHIIGVDFSERLAKVQKNDCQIFAEVKYIYYVKGHEREILKSCRNIIQTKYKKSVENEEVIVYTRK